MARRRKSSSFWQSVRYAGLGVWEACTTEPNVRRQALILVAVLVAGMALRVSRMEMLVVWTMGGVVLALELMNSALESVLDTLHPARSSGVRRAKDIAAGAVLIASVMAAVVGAVIFGSALAARW